MRRTLRSPPQRGAALWIIAAVIVMIAGLGLALLLTTNSTARETQSAHHGIRAFYASEGAVNEAYAVLSDGGPAALEALTYPRSLDGATYTVHVTHGNADPNLGNDLIRLIGTATVGSTTTHTELILRSDGADAVAPGAFGDEIVELDAGSIVDSYDSSLGTYASQATNTWGTQAYANANAPAGSNLDVEVKGTSAVLGDAHSGPTGTTTVEAGSHVSGSTAPAAASIALPAITVPAIAQSATINLDGTNLTLTPGTYGYTTWDMKNSATLTIEGPAVIVVDTVKITASNVTFDTSGGPVEIYVKVGWTLDNSTAAPADGDPSGVELSMTPVNQNLEFKNSASFTGKVYAPDGTLKMMGGASILGSAIADDILMNDASIHVDESLTGSGSGGGAGYSHVAWRPLSPVQADAITGP